MFQFLVTSNLSAGPLIKVSHCSLIFKLPQSVSCKIDQIGFLL